MSDQTVVAFAHEPDVSGGSEITVTSLATKTAYMIYLDTGFLVDDTVDLTVLIDDLAGASNLVPLLGQVDTPFTGANEWDSRWAAFGPVIFGSSTGLIRFILRQSAGTSSPLAMSWFVSQIASAVTLVEEGEIPILTDGNGIDVLTYDVPVSAALPQGIYVFRLNVEPLRDGDTIHVWRTLTPNTGGGGATQVVESLTITDEQGPLGLPNVLDVGPVQSFDPDLSSGGTLRSSRYHVRQTAGDPRDFTYQLMRLTP